jgi:DNA-binding transcriptional LysR family regulator
MDLRSFQIAAAVVESGSMTDAARRFGITQSAVSQAVRKAEGEVGARLFERRRRPLAPTSAGQLLAERIGDLNRSFDALVSDLRQAAVSPVKIDMRLGLVDSFAGTVGPRMIHALLAGASKLNLTVWSGLAASHAEALMNRTIDAAVTCDPMHELTEVERLHLLTESYVLVIPAKAEGLAGKDLAEIFSAHRLVRHSGRSFVGAQVERHLGRLDVRPQKSFEFDTSDAVIGMVANGMGVAITTPLCILQGGAHLRGVAVSPLPGPGFSRELHLVTRAGDLAYLAPRIATAARAALAGVDWPFLDSQSVSTIRENWRLAVAPPSP